MSSRDGHLTSTYPRGLAAEEEEMSNGEVEDEIVLPGLVGEREASSEPERAPRIIELGQGLSDPAEPEVESDDEEVCCIVDLLS